MYQGEQTLLTTRPTRLISFGYYVLWVVLWAAAVAFFFRLVPYMPAWSVPGLGWTAEGLLAAVFLFFGFIALLYGELRRVSTRYIITDNKVIREDGILSKRTDMVPYTQLERVELNQSLGQRLLRIGTLVIDTGDDMMKIEMVPQPAKIQELLSQRMGRRAFFQQQQQR